MRLILALMLSIFCLGSASFVQAADRCNVQHVACKSDRISWVSVTFFNDATKGHLKNGEAYYETKIRAFLRRELPNLKHNVRNPFGGEHSQSGVYAMSDEENSRSAAVDCTIGVTQSRDNFAVYQSCEMISFLRLKHSKTPDLEAGVLGVSKTSDISGQMVDYLRGLVKHLSDKFYQDLSRFEQFTSLKNRMEPIE